MSHLQVDDRPSPLTYEPLQPHDDPYPLYRRLRDEAPVFHNEELECWVLSRYDDVQGAARDWETFSLAEGNDLDNTAELFAPAGELTHADPPVHTRLRDAVRREFAVRTVRENLEPMVRSEVKRLIAGIHGRRKVDFATELARPLPAGLVCGWLGFPESDHASLLAWFGAMHERVPGHIELPASALVGRDAMRAYLREEIAARRGHPRGDLLSAIVTAEGEHKLSEDESIGVAMMLFFAGITTTSALIANSMVNLHAFKSRLSQLRESPELIPTAIEELLRFDAPLQWLTRMSTREVEMHGTSIPAGARVLLLWGSANRDERRWDRPDELDFMRDPKRHISFGEGIHHCLGAPLARLEAKVLLEELLPLLADFGIESVKRPHTQNERTIASLPASVIWADVA